VLGGVFELRLRATSGRPRQIWWRLTMCSSIQSPTGSLGSSLPEPQAGAPDQGVW